MRGSETYRSNNWCSQQRALRDNGCTFLCSCGHLPFIAHVSSVRRVSYNHSRLQRAIAINVLTDLETMITVKGMPNGFAWEMGKWNMKLFVSNFAVIQLMRNFHVSHHLRGSNCHRKKIQYDVDVSSGEKHWTTTVDKDWYVFVKENCEQKLCLWTCLVRLYKCSDNHHDAIAIVRFKANARLCISIATL